MQENIRRHQKQAEMSRSIERQVKAKKDKWMPWKASRNYGRGAEVVEEGRRDWARKVPVPYK